MNGDIYLKIKDNGKGFVQDGIMQGNGLNNMKERALKIGGILDIDSKEGEGTIIKFSGNII